jgi:hypothetical protein
MQEEDLLGFIYRVKQTFTQIIMHVQMLFKGVGVEQVMMPR